MIDAEGRVLTAVKALTLSGCPWEWQDVTDASAVEFEGANTNLKVFGHNLAVKLGCSVQGDTYIPDRRYKLTREELRRGALRQRAATYSKAHRQRLLQEGKCPTCGGERDGDTKNCRKCLDRAKGYADAYKGKTGHCRRRSADAYSKGLDRIRNLRAERKTAGLCPTCGGEPEPNRVQCPKCLARQRIASARYKAKRNGKG